MVSKPQPLVDTRPAVRQLAGQLVLLCLLALIAGLLWDVRSGMSALVGAGIAVIGQAYFVARAFNHAGVRSAQHIVNAFYRGEVGKFMLTALLFATVFITWKEVRVGWLFASFILEQLVAWIVPFTIKSAQR